MKNTILITERLDPEVIKHFSRNEDFKFIILENASPQEINENIKNCGALIVRSKTKVDKELLSAGKKLVVVGRAGVGTDNIDIDYAEKNGILVINAPEESLDSVADLTIGLIIATCRNFKIALARTTRGNFNRLDLSGVELRNKVLGIMDMEGLVDELLAGLKDLD